MSEEMIETTENDEIRDGIDEEPARSIVIEEAIEAILFAAGHPVSYATLARVFNITPSEIRNVVADYAIKYNNSEIPRGVLFLTYADSCQLCTKQHYITEIRDALGIKKSGTLSTSALETLAIVAYNQPVTRIFVDTLRKVDSSYAMNSLIDRGLIECKGRLDVPGRPMLYGTTSDFLRCFGIKDLDSLPRTTEEMMDAFAKAKIDTDPTDNSVSNAEQLQIIETEKDSSTEEQIEAPSVESTEEVKYELEEPSAEDDLTADNND